MPPNEDTKEPPLSEDDINLSSRFPEHWKQSTADHNLTLHGFRRFKTTHLLNLRFLESEIAELDWTIYQAGLKLDTDTSPEDRLGLKHARKQREALAYDEIINREFILKLRDLLRQYDDALATFKTIMSMETFSLLDDGHQAGMQRGLSLYEVYNTRLVRLDQGSRVPRDPLQRRIHRCLRKFRYWRLSRRQNNSRANSRHGENPTLFRDGDRWKYQDSTIVAEILSRLLVTVTTGIFVMVPLAILAYQSSKSVQIAVIGVSVILFAALISSLLRASNVEMMVVAVAYGAILSVFVSNAALK